MDRGKGMAHIKIRRAPNIKDSGKITYSTGKAKKSGLMAPRLMESTKMGKSKVVVCSSGAMARSTLAWFKIISYTGKAYSRGQMVVNTWETGAEILCKVRALSVGLTVGSTEDSTRKTSSTVTVSLSIQTVGNISEIGRTVFKMATGSTSVLMGRNTKVSG